MKTTKSIAEHPAVDESIHSSSDLPVGFEALSEFAREWGSLETNVERYLKRQSSTLEELRSFYDVATPLLDHAFNHLDTFPYGQLPDKELRLFHTMLGLLEAAQAVEVFNAARVPRAPYPHRDYVLEEF